MPTQSITDQLSGKIAPIMRKLKDINISIVGTQTQLLRILTGEMDLSGETTETLQTQVIERVVIQHPWANDIQMFGATSTAGDTVMSAIDLWEVLPIKIYLPFSGDKLSTLTDIKKGDILVECLRDEHGSKIPLVMTITRGFGAFSSKYIVSKHLEATLYRGTLPASVQTAVNIYLASIV